MSRGGAPHRRVRLRPRLERLHGGAVGRGGRRRRRAGRPGRHRRLAPGLVSDVVDRSTVAVVVPHEYAAVAPAEPDELLARTVAFGVEHPGTATFTASAQAPARLGARFEISQRSLDALAELGLDGTLFPLGHVPRWDRWGGGPVERDVDVAYLGTADPRRLGILAHAARLAGRAAHRAAGAPARADDGAAAGLPRRRRQVAAARAVEGARQPAPGGQGDARVGPGAGGDPQRLRRGHRAVDGPGPAAARRAPARGGPRQHRSGGGRRRARRRVARPDRAGRRTTCAGGARHGRPRGGAAGRLPGARRPAGAGATASRSSTTCAGGPTAWPRWRSGCPRSTAAPRRRR